MLFRTPILFIVFNRPDTTARVFERIRQIQPAQLFIAADGPRAAKEGEKEKCDEVRNIILQGIDWPCDVKTLIRDSNLGCGPAVSNAITWFFENVEEGIILEDDTLPDLSFFNYCTILLERYRNDNKIKMIGGANFQNGNQRGSGSYYFSAYGCIWGWASWRRAWKEYDFTLAHINKISFSESLDHYFKENNIKVYWTEMFDRIKRGEINTWDFQLLFSIWYNKGISIMPNVNLVSNIGFGESSTHTTNRNDPFANRPIVQMKDIMHPERKEISDDADSFFFKTYLKQESRWKRRIKKVLATFKF